MPLIELSIVSDGGQQHKIIHILVISRVRAKKNWALHHLPTCVPTSEKTISSYCPFKHCFICRPSDSTVPEYAGMESYRKMKKQCWIRNRPEKATWKTRCLCRCPNFISLGGPKAIQSNCERWKPSKLGLITAWWSGCCCCCCCCW